MPNLMPLMKSAFKAEDIGDLIKTCDKDMNDYAQLNQDNIEQGSSFLNDELYSMCTPNCGAVKL